MDQIGGSGMDMTDQELLGLSTTDRQLDRLVQKLPDVVVEGKGKSVEKL